MTARKARRKAGEGSIGEYSTADGKPRWLIVYRVRDLGTGQSKRVLRRGFTTERKATTALRAALVKVDNHTYSEPSKQPLGEYLAQWLDGLQLEPSTNASYRKNVRLHITPYLGGTPLLALTPTMLSAHYRNLELDGRKDGRAGGLSARTVRYVHTILSGALRDAVGEGRLIVNPCAQAKPPTAKAAKSPEMKVWTPEQLRAFLEHAQDGNDELYPLWLLYAATGMRRGEGLGLRWGDFDWSAGTVAVRRAAVLIKTHGGGEKVMIRPPKSGKPRVIDVDPQTLGVLKTYRAERASIDLRLAAPDAYVAAQANGEVRHPERTSRAWVYRMGTCDLPAIRLHDLRHSHATALLVAGVHPKVVSERLGHASVMITLTVYSHVLPSMQRAAADQFGAALYGTGES